MSGEGRDGRYKNSRAGGEGNTTSVLAWTVGWGQFWNTYTWGQCSGPHLKFQVPIHGQQVGKQISFGVLILYASKVMNYWMGPFSVNIFIIFLFHPSCGEQGEAEMGKHFAKSFERYLPLWIAPWFEVLFPSQGGLSASGTTFNATIVQKKSHPVF